MGLQGCVKAKHVPLAWHIYDVLRHRGLLTPGQYLLLQRVCTAAGDHAGCRRATALMQAGGGAGWFVGMARLAGPDGTPAGFSAGVTEVV
eukprot:NODE_1110_length_684_cov_21601.503937_g757_i0.p1 GENE.NODE_1110_length_684_cov_21601.503937_g757_i0~~NODE_1110_length_684_cov_21601.503937_g757_i0.p1  ORF type:complete len:100 (+),score=57.84 NODE_1110_length_684_cov_21601.503937_g757_i0:31-300(+)